MLSVKQGSIKYHFWVFGVIRSGIEPWSPEALANTLLIRPIHLLLYLVQSFNTVEFIDKYCLMISILN